MTLNFLVNNLRLKFAAVGLAIVLWLVIVMEQRVEQDFSVRVVYTLPPGSVIKSASPGTLRARISGPRILVAQAAIKGVEAQLDLRGAVTGRVIFTNLERTLILPRDLLVVRLQPPVVEVVVARRDDAADRGQ